MTETSKWFGQYFSELHPLLQKLHLNGGTLNGEVNIKLGKGIVAGFLGKKIANKLNIPTNKGKHILRVDISHANNELHWNRCFDNTNIVESTFIPFGQKPSGYWVEQTGAVELYLTVDIKNQGWYWRCTKVKVRGIPFPLWLFPSTQAYKYIESGKYHFHVSFSLLIFGTVLSYSGLLSPEIKKA